MDNQKDNSIKDISLADSPSRWAKYVSLKGQKLTQAVYYVTTNFPDSEPLKWRLRDVSLDILSDLSLMQPINLDAGDVSQGHHLSPLFKVSVLESASLKISQIISWLNVSLAGNFSSDLNLVILRDEYVSFQSFLNEKVSNHGVKKMLSPGQEEIALNSPGVESVRSELSVSHRLPEQINKGQIVTDRVDSRHYQKISQLPHKNRDVAKDSRRSVIVDFLKGKDWTSIKDIADAVGGCSTKTIQRELSELVQKGILRKKGDRRWSRYLLS